jgi:glycosyltransferase involved in cell wall biosynthesis
MQNNIVLTICVCSVLERSSTFLPNILKQLQDQVIFDDVEILLLLDNKKTMLGDKRNAMLSLAKGKYITFVDDDDRLSDDYVYELRQACLTTNKDVITFIVDVSLNGQPSKPCYYSKQFGVDYNLNDSYYRIPNHIMCVKKELVMAVKYKSILRGEDADYSKRLLPLLNSEHNINKVLYYYDFNINTTVTQQQL